jgi:hypothetical protein
MKNDDDDDVQQQQQLLREEWKHDALREYELIAALCNAQSILVEAVALSSSSSSLLGVSRSSTTNYSNEDDTSSQILTNTLQQRKVTESLAAYYEAIHNVRTAHASLKARLSLLSSSGSSSSDVSSNYAVILRKQHQKSSNYDSKIKSNSRSGEENKGYFQQQQQQQQQRRLASNTPNNEFVLHSQLVERVLRTVMRMSSPPNNLNVNRSVGVLYTNGIIDIPSQNEYETNIVALAAVRASLSQLSLMI